ncbi:MAG: gluconate 2-dehydrogenase subunit 3 family protein, partial [Candidatus Limnocylindria bacterium]
MHRRELLRVLGAAATLPALGALTLEELLGAGAALHARRRLSGPLSFQALTPHEAATVTAIAEAIIPATDTPGATDAGVPEFIDLIVGEWYYDDERAAFLAGLREVDARSRMAHGADFIDTDAAA